MSRLNSEIDSLLESDEVSQIDGLNYRSKSYSNVRDYEKSKPQLSRTSSARGLEPDIATRRHKYEERSKRKARHRARNREFEKSIEDSMTSELEGDISDESTAYDSYSSSGEKSIRGSSEKNSDSSESRRRKKKTRKKPELKPKHKSLTTKLKEKVSRKKRSPSPAKKDEKKVYEKLPPHTRKEIMSLTQGFIPVPRVEWPNIEAGSEIMWMSKGSGRVCDRATPAYYWYQKESKKGRMFFMCGPTATCDLKTQWVKRRKFPLFWDQTKKLYVREDPFTHGLRLAIDNRTVQISDIAHFLKMKYGDEFDQFMKNRALDRAHTKK
jgi:hypothetical protein